MATIERDQNPQRFSRGITPSRGKALTTADNIGGFARTEDDGPDLLEVLNRKLEPTGVLANGTADPVFANETALVYHQTTDNTLFLRGSSAYTELQVGTDANIYPVFFDSATEPDITTSATWDGTTFTPPITGTTSWSLTKPNNPTNTVWQRVYYVEEASYIVSSASAPIANINASLIAYTPPSNDGNIPQSVDNVDEALDAFHDADLTQGGGGGGGSTQQPADWDATTGVTRILNKPPPYEYTATPTIDRNNLNRIGAQNVSEPFTINPDMVAISARYGIPITVSGYGELNLQRVSDPVRDNVHDKEVTFSLEVIQTNPQDPFATGVLDTGSVQTSADRDAMGDIKVHGLVPAGTGTFRLRTTLTGREETNVGVGWVSSYRVVVQFGLHANQIGVNQDDLGNNYTANTNGLDTVGDIINQGDEFPAALSTSNNIAWDSAGVLLTGAVTNGQNSNRRRVYSIRQLIRDSNIRVDRQYIIRLRGNIVRRTPGAAVLYTLDVHSDVDYTQHIRTAPYDTASHPNFNFEIRIPPRANLIQFTLKETSGEDSAGARLNVNTFSIELVEGANTENYVDTGRITTSNDMSLDAIAKALNAYIPGAASTEVTVDSNQLRNPNIYPGGGRARDIESDYTVKNPANQQQMNVNFDLRLQAAYDAYHRTQGVILNGSSPESDSFAIVGTGSLLSSSINVLPAITRISGTNLLVRGEFRVNSIDTGFEGTIRLVNNGGANDRITDTVDHDFTDTDYDPGNIVAFEQIVNSANIQDPFRIQVAGQTGNTVNATIDRGSIYMEPTDRTTGAVGGGGGGTGTLLWEHGPNISDRLTSAATQTLRSGITWTDYDYLLFMFDNGPTAYPAFTLWIPVDRFITMGSYGAITFTDLRGYRVHPVGVNNNQFSFDWGNNGLREVWGY